MIRPAAALCLVVPAFICAAALPAVASASKASGGVSIEASAVSAVPSTAEKPTVAGSVAVILPDGKAAAPESAPAEVQDAIWAANKIVGKPYRYGGGHARFNDTGYDCSGTISYALKGAKALTAPLDSTSFMSWGEPGVGAWITVYTHPTHAFIVIAGLRLDTSAAGDPGGKKGPRWRPVLRATKGFTVRHPEGL